MEIVALIFEFSELCAHKGVGSGDRILNFLPAIPASNECELAVLAIELLEIPKLEHVGLEDLLTSHLFDGGSRSRGDERVVKLWRIEHL